MRTCAAVAQLVRAPDCGSGGRRFESTQLYQSSLQAELAQRVALFTPLRRRPKAGFITFPNDLWSSSCPKEINAGLWSTQYRRKIFMSALVAQFRSCARVNSSPMSRSFRQAILVSKASFSRKCTSRTFPNMRPPDSIRTRAPDIEKLVTVQSIVNAPLHEASIPVKSVRRRLSLRLLGIAGPCLAVSPDTVCRREASSNFGLEDCGSEAFASGRPKRVSAMTRTPTNSVYPTKRPLKIR